MTSGRGQEVTEAEQNAATTHTSANSLFYSATYNLVCSQRVVTSVYSSSIKIKKDQWIFFTTASWPLIFHFHIISIDNTFLLHFLCVWNVSSDVVLSSHLHKSNRNVLRWVFLLNVILDASCQIEMSLKRSDHFGHFEPTLCWKAYMFLQFFKLTNQTTEI